MALQLIHTRIHGTGALKMFRDRDLQEPLPSNLNRLSGIIGNNPVRHSVCDRHLNRKSGNKDRRSQIAAMGKVREEMRIAGVNAIINSDYFSEGLLLGG
jgi:hypothetical protein